MDFSAEAPDVQQLASSIGLDKLSGPINYNPGLVTTTAPKQPQPGFFSKLAGQVGNAAAWAGGQVWNAAKTAVSAFPNDVAMNVNRGVHLNPLIDQANALNQENDALFASAKSMSKAEFNAKLRDLTQRQVAMSAAIRGANDKYQYAGTGQVAADYAGLAGVALTAAAPFAAPLEEGASALASGVTKGVESVVGRSGARLTKNLAGMLAGKAARNALLTQPTVNWIPSMVNDVNNKDYGAVMANLGLMVTVPALIHFAAPVVAEGFQKLGLKMFGNPSFLGRFQFANGENFQSFFNDLSAKAATGDAQAQQELVRYTNIAQQFVDHNAREGNSAMDVMTSEARNLRPVNEQTARQFLDYHADFISDTQKVQDVVAQNPEKYGIPKGVSMEQIGVGNFGIPEKTALIRELMSAPDQAAREGIILRDWAQNKDYTRNDGVRNQVWAAVKSGQPNAIEAIKDITGTRAIKGADDLGLSQGRIPIVKPKGAAGFANPAELPPLEFGQPRSTGALGKAGTLMEKFGLSPQATEQGATRAALRDTFERELQGTKWEGRSNDLLRKLDEARNTVGVADIRELKPTDIQLALGNDATMADAKDVRAALHNAYMRIPARVVGLGPKAVNLAMARVPFMDNYMRLQQRYKFDSNPFFRAKRATKNYLAAVAKGGQVVPRPSEETLTALRKEGLFNRFLTDQGVADYLGVSPQEIGATGEGEVQAQRQALGAKGKQFGVIDQRVIGGLAENIAGRFGMTVPEALAAEDQTAADAIKAATRLTVGYGEGGYLNSPLAKTLNILVFPSRFDTKIGMIAYHALANQPPIVQAMIMHGLVNTASFLQSPQGQTWQQQNAEMLGLVKYFTPLGTIDNVMKFLGNGYHIGDLGEVGGLPFGVITTFLNDTFPYGPLGQSQYYNPSTGSPVPTQVPNTAKAGLQTLLQTLVESTFSWPGRQAGLALSKGQIVQALPGLKTAPGETTPTFAPGVNPQGGPGQSSAAEPTPQPIVNPLPAPANVSQLPKSATARTKRSRVKVVPQNLQIRR